MQRISFVLLILAILLSTNKAWAQDPQFSQYYSAPLYLNPALAGITQQGRAGINYRNQWPSIDANFETFSLYVDNNFDEKNSSVGLLFVNDKEGWSLPSGILAMLLGCVFIYSCLFATGYWIYGETTLAISITITAIVSGYLLKRTWVKIRAKVL